MKKKIKIAEIGPYPPPDTGWSVRIKKVKTALEAKGYQCTVLNTGKNRKEKSPHYMDVQSGFDYLLKLFLLKLKGYRFHIHTNAQAVKGPILCLIAHCVSLLFFSRAKVTFHGGNKQLYFPVANAGKIYPVIYLNFLLSKNMICNDESIKDLISSYGFGIRRDKIHPIQAFSSQYVDFTETSLPAELTAFINDKRIFIFSYIALRNGFYLETLCEFIENCDPKTGIVLTGCGKVEDPEIKLIYERLLKLEQDGKVFLIKALSHDEFMTAAKQADIFLRTPDSDGVSASVLEALSLGTVVVASENYKRPDSVVTYTPDDAMDLGRQVNLVISRQSEFEDKIVRPEIKDTVDDEIAVLLKD